MTTHIRVPDNHPQRFRLHNEAHARQPTALPLPARASHLALILDAQQRSEERQHLKMLCERYNLIPPRADADHLNADFGVFQLLWQQHGEFSTYTFFRSGASDEPFAQSAICSVPTDWLAGLAGQLIVSAHAEIVSIEGEEPDLDNVSSHFAGNAVVGSKVAGGAALAMTDFFIHQDGFSRFLIIDRHLEIRQAGRLIQRLFDIEVYRVMSLLAFPMARELIPKLNQADEGLLRITAGMADEESDDAALLDDLSTLATLVENHFATTHFRFGAAQAYHKVVRRRLEDLRQERIEGIQTIGEFLTKRLEPALNTCETTATRLSMLSERIANAGQLLRTRVDITLERQNQALLTSMNRRADLQLRLQETVEGLSVAAISYYTVSLIGYLAKAAKSFGWPVVPEMVVGVSIPIVIVVIAVGVRHIRKMVNHA